MDCASTIRTPYDPAGYFEALQSSFSDMYQVQKGVPPALLFILSSKKLSPPAKRCVVRGR